MSRVIAVQLVVASVAFCAGSAVAQERVVLRSTTNLPRVLAAHLDRTQMTFLFDEPSELIGAAVLRLQWVVSDALAGDGVTLTVSFDGKPVKTLLVDAAGEGVATILLARASAGFHTVELSTRSKNKDCELSRRADTWVSIQMAEVSWKTTAAYRPSVATLFNELVQRTPRVTMVGLSAMDSVGKIEALIEFDNWTRRLGRQPVEAKNELDADLIIDFEQAEPCESAAIVSVRAVSSLRVSGCDPKSIARFFAFVDDRDLRRCEETLCYFNTEELFARGTNVGRKAISARTRIEKLGRPKGWIARGEGTHSFDVRWLVPSNAALRRWPQLRLDATWSVPPGPVDSEANVQIELNGRPIGSWTLRGEDQGSLVAKVPEHFFDEDVWTFRTSVQLRSGADRCEATNQESLWFQISETSELRAEYERSYHQGLGELWLEHKSAEVDIQLASATISQAFATGAVAHALRHKKSRVRVVAACGKAPCIRVHHSASEDELPVVSHAIGARHFWRLRHVSSVNRLLPMTKSVVLSVRDSNILDLFVGESFEASSARLVPPQLGDFDGASAYFIDKGWSSVGEVTPIAVKVAAQLQSDAVFADTITTNESATVINVDISLLCIGGALLVIATIQQRRMRAEA